MTIVVRDPLAEPMIHKDFQAGLRTFRVCIGGRRGDKGPSGVAVLMILKIRNGITYHQANGVRVPVSGLPMTR